MTKNQERKVKIIMIDGWMYLQKCEVEKMKVIMEASNERKVKKRKEKWRRFNH